MKLIVIPATALLALLSAAFAGAGPAAQSVDKKPDHLKMALVNIKSVYSDGPDAAKNKANIQANLKRHMYFIDQLAAQGAEFVGFPELSVNGYHFSKNMTWLSLDGPEVEALRKKAIAKGIYISVGIALEDADGKRWNAQIVIDPQGRIIGLHRKIWLTKEKGFTEAGSAHKVFDVKGIKMGIAICADGTDRKNLQALVDNGAQLIYGPHANTTGGTIAGWYKFRAAWAGPEGWIAELKVYAALHNQAGLYNPEFAPPTAKDANTGWASGAWFIGPDGKTLKQMPTSANRNDSKEFVLICDVPLGARSGGPASKEGAEKKELEKFQGKWALVSITVDGKAAPEEKLKDQFMLVKGAKSSAVHQDKERGSGALKLDPSKKPAHYEITYEDGPAKGTTLKGIYKVEADTVTIALAAPGKERPTEFASPAGSGSMLFVFRRVK